MRRAFAIARQAERDTPNIARRSLSRPRSERLIVDRRFFDDDYISRHKLDLDIERRRSSRFPEQPVRKPFAVPPQRRVEEKSKPANADRRFYHPEVGYTGSDVYGGRAKVTVSPDIDRSAFIYARPELATPCLWRKTRRQVMFALKKAGKGYHKRKRRNETSNYECI